MTSAELTVFATSDLHAHWRRENGTGIAAAAETVRQARVRGIDAIWIDNGDTLNGAPLGASVARRVDDHPVLPALDELGLDVWVPGNHDFDHGVDALRGRVGALRRAQCVCANVVTADGTPLFPPSTVIERSGVRVGVIGAVTGHVQRLTRYDAVSGVRFLDPVEPVVREAHRLRDRVDVLIVSYHGGFEADPFTGNPTQYDTGEDQAYRLLRTSPGIDGLIVGHQHRLAAGEADGATGPVAFVQPGYGGERVGTLRFEVREGRAIRLAAENVVPVPVSAEAALPPRVMPLARAAAGVDEWWDRESVGHDALHGIIQRRTGVDASALLLPETPLTWRDLSRALPAPYGVETYRLPREELLAGLGRAEGEGADLGLRLSTRGLDLARLPEHVTLVAGVSLRRALPAGRVQEASPYNWLDEVATAQPAT